MNALQSVIAVAAAVLAITAPAHAWTGHATRATFLRAGPGLEYSVTDEVDHEAALDVLKCTGDWCEVRFEGSIGWVMASTVTQATPAPVPPHEAQACFVDRQAGYGKGEQTRFCPR